MKVERRLGVLVSLLAIVFFTVGCSLITPPPPPSIISELTEEQIKNIIDHSCVGNCVTRWPDGNMITVYDETGFPLLEEVLEEWNEALSFKIFLKKVNNKEEAKVVIVFKILEGYLGYATVWYNDKYQIERGLIEIHPQVYNAAMEIGGKALTMLKGLYLHEFGHIVGIHRHFEQGLMASPKQTFYIDPYTRSYVWLLYQIPVGYCFVNF